MPKPHKNFIYNEERKFIFAYVPKVACTNWKSLLRYMAGCEDWLDNRRAHDKINGGLRYLDLAGSDRALLKDGKIKKYTMVRDPYSRILSAYLNKIESRLPISSELSSDGYWADVVKDIDEYRRRNFKLGEYPEVCFPVFLHWLNDSYSDYTKDEHWSSQSHLLRQPDLKFDDIGRFETLPEDSARILEAMGCDQTFPTQKDVSFAPTGANDKVARYFTPECFVLVNEIFADDFQNFQYPMTIPEPGQYSLPQAKTGRERFFQRIFSKFRNS